MLKAGAKLETMNLSEQYLIDCGYNGELVFTQCFSSLLGFLFGSLSKEG
jgi:hypothetical protein